MQFFICSIGKVAGFFLHIWGLQFKSDSRCEKHTTERLLMSVICFLGQTYYRMSNLYLCSIISYPMTSYRKMKNLLNCRPEMSGLWPSSAYQCISVPRSETPEVGLRLHGQLTRQRLLRSLNQRGFAERDPTRFDTHVWPFVMPSVDRLCWILSLSL